MKDQKQPRKILLEGDVQDHSLLIGNYGDVDFVVNGNFDISGTIYLRGTLSLAILGSGTLRLSGFCKKVMIHLVKGDCSIDFGDLTSKEFSCYSLRDTSSLVLGPTKVIARANVQDEAVFRYSSTPLVKHYSVVGKGRMEAVV